MYQLKAQQVITNNDKNKKNVAGSETSSEKNATVDKLPTLISSLMPNLKSKI
jgi:hypothetical protein